jgi:hypothetical protein
MTTFPKRSSNQSEIDHLIFFYPPRGYAKFPSEILQLRLGLYGAKQSAAIWANILNTFLLNLPRL